MNRSFVQKRIIAVTAFWLTAALLAGCSGSGDLLAGGGIGGTGATVASVGTVSGFGSVIVNSVVYDTTGAEVFVENLSKGSGDSAVAGNLLVGMVVRVEGRISEDGSATAERVLFSSTLKGPVESVIELDAVSRQAVILGQTILMDDRTAFHNVSPASLAEGMVLEVSGYDDEAGRIFATYVNKVADSLPPGGQVESKGVVRNVIAPLERFQIRQLTVDYSAADLGGLPGNAPEAGQLVKAIGQLEEMNLLAAERLELEEEFGAGLFDVVDLEGIITEEGGAGEFGIGRYSVRFDQGTFFRNLNPQDLKPGARVVVHGPLTDRTIQADEIFLPERIRMESNAASVDPVEKSLVLSGLETAVVFAIETTLTVGIVSVFDAIAPGDHVRVLGRRNGGDIVASIIVVTPSNDAVELAGPVEFVSEPSIVMMGIEIDTSSIPPDGFKGPEGEPVSHEEFFGAVRLGVNVAVKGLLEAAAVNWTGIAIE
jgi:hypothetical protein